MVSVVGFRSAGRLYWALTDRLSSSAVYGVCLSVAPYLCWQGVTSHCVSDYPLCINKAASSTLVCNGVFIRCPLDTISLVWHFSRHASFIQTAIIFLGNRSETIKTWLQEITICIARYSNMTFTWYGNTVSQAIFWKVICFWNLMYTLKQKWMRWYRVTDLHLFCAFPSRTGLRNILSPFLNRY